MKRNHANHLLGRLLFVTGIGIALPAAAETGVPQVGMEADQISLSFNGEAGGKVLAQGCKACPLELRFDASTQFYLYGAMIGRGQAKSHSGQAGTVNYDPEHKRVIEIRW